MEEEISLAELIALANTKIELGTKLTQDLHQIEHVEGVQKVVRKIKQEISALTNVQGASAGMQFRPIIVSNPSPTPCRR